MDRICPTETPISILKAFAQPSMLRANEQMTTFFTVEIISLHTEQLAVTLHINSLDAGILPIKVEEEFVVSPSSITTLKTCISAEPKERGEAIVVVTLSDSVPPPPRFEFALRVS